MICAIIASEFDNIGRREMFSFQAFETGNICMAATTTSAAAVLNKMALVTTGTGPQDATLLVDPLRAHRPR